MKKILVTIPLKETQKQRFQALAKEMELICVKSKDVTEELVQDASIILGNVSPAFLTGSQKLEWIQLNSAGANDYTVPGILPAGVKLTNATGAYGLAISEHMLGMLLELQKKLHLYQQNQAQHCWKDEGNVTSIDGSRTLVVGMGDIGGEFAKRMHALGSTVTGIRRNKAQKPDYLDALYQMDALDELLPQMDVVALSLPNTKETHHLFDAARFAKMKPGVILLNVGRGNVIDQDALCEALNSRRLGGAGLDVTDPEPLPADHPLWDAKNLILTPHVSGAYHLAQTLQRIVDISLYNLEAFLHGEELNNQVDFETGYRKFIG